MSQSIPDFLDLRDLSEYAGHVASPQYGYAFNLSGQRRTRANRRRESVLELLSGIAAYNRLLDAHSSPTRSASGSIACASSAMSLWRRLFELRSRRSSGSSILLDGEPHAPSIGVLAGRTCGPGNERYT